MEDFQKMKEYNETLQRIKELLAARGWSVYRLSLESNIPESSLNTLFKRNNEPTLPTLRKICQGFKISLSDFFSYEKTPEFVDLSADEINLLVEYRATSKSNKKLLKAYLAGLNKVLPEEIK